ncbi:hypothetical protein [Chroococcidiopsis sp.]|uniref:hypothetical protein n=1 Tax=Chroococcidiopsis sp. TaxID=3088168 RepID=UPI003F3B9B32
MLTNQGVGSREQGIEKNLPLASPLIINFSLKQANSYRKTGVLWQDLYSRRTMTF